MFEIVFIHSLNVILVIGQINLFVEKFIWVNLSLCCMNLGYKFGGSSGIIIG